MDIRAKGELGLRLTWLAALAFVLCILGQTLLLGLLLGLVLIKERNEWLSRQVLAAFLLSIVESLLGVVRGAVSVVYGIPLLGSVFSMLFGLVFGLLSLALLVLAILAAVHTAAGKEAGIPLLDKLTASAFHKAEPVAPAPPAPPVTPAPPAPPAPPAES